MSFQFSKRFFGSVPKLPGDAERNEDAFAWSGERSVVALSDGASESFDSRLWARILVRLFVLDPNLSMARVNTAISAFTRRHDPSSMSWSRHAAFQRGSFATLLGVEVSPNMDEARILAIGDTTAVLLDDNRLVACFPYTAPEDFQRRPTLLSTRPAFNGFLDRPEHTRMSTTVWQLDRLEAPRIVCMTDAIAEWFLRQAVDDPCAGDCLLGFSETADLESLVVQERQAGRIHVDDTTVLILE